MKEWHHEASAGESTVSACAADTKAHRVIGILVVVMLLQRDWAISYVMTHHITLLTKKILLPSQSTKSVI
jgi:hypothetical protein